MNKKIVLLIICVVVIFSIVIVAIFGLKADVGSKVVKVDGIYITNKEGTKISEVIEIDGQMVESVTFNLTNAGSATFIIYYNIMPDHATNKTVLVDQSQEVSSKINSLKVDSAKGQIIITFSTIPTSGYLSIKCADNQNIKAIVGFTNHSGGGIDPI